MHRHFKKFFVLAILLPFFLAACGGGTSNSQSSSSSAANSARSSLKFYVITHGQASDPFWSVVKKGVDQAAKDMGVQVVYEAPPTFLARQPASPLL